MKRLMVLFSALCIALCLLATPQVRVQKLNKQQLQEALSVIGKITFVDGKIQVYSIENDLLLTTDITEETAIVISENNESVIIDDGEDKKDYGITTNVDENSAVVNIYPNPATDVLNIEGVEKGSVIRLYNINGALLLSAQAESNKHIVNVESLANGIYLLQINNSLLKLVKE